MLGSHKEDQQWPVQPVQRAGHGQSHQEAVQVLFHSDQHNCRVVRAPAGPRAAVNALRVQCFH